MPRPYSGTLAAEHHQTVIYKRLPLRDSPNLNAPVLAPLEVSEFTAVPPPWHLSLPHILIASISSILSGYHIGVVNAPLEFIAHDLGFKDNALAQGTVVSICLLGAFIGCASSGVIADGFGRKRSLQLSVLPMILGACLSATASNLSAMVFGRLLVGLGLGFGSPVTCLYVSEVSPTHVRGTYGSILQIATCTGILGALVVGLPASTTFGWWRVCFWVSIFPAAFLAVGMEFCCESPRWLFKQSRWNEAEHEIERLWGSMHVKMAIADLSRNAKTEEIGQATFMDAFSKPYRKVVLVGAALFIFQQLSGINAVFYFSTTVFKNAGIASDLTASVAVGVVNLLASVIAAYLMDRYGRRNLLIWSFTGMSVAMAIQALVAAYPTLPGLQGFLSVFGTLMFVFTFALGVGPVPALLLPEIFPSRIRAKGMAICMCAHWIANCLVALLFLQLLKKLGTATVYFFFATICFVAVVFVRKNILETKGKSLEEIESLLLQDS